MGKQRRGGRPEVAIELTPKERQRLEQLSRSRTAPYREVMRARALLRAAQGQGNRAISHIVDANERTVRTWRKDFVQRRLDCLQDRQRSGRRRTFEPRVRAALTHLACQKPGTQVSVPPDMVAPQGPPSSAARAHGQPSSKGMPAV